MEELGCPQRLVDQPAASAPNSASIDSPSSTPSSPGKSGPRDFSSRESDTPEVPTHQKLKHFVTELGSLVDSLTLDSASLESEKAEKELWKKMYEELKREREKALKKILELERNLDGKQKLEMEIEEFKRKLEGMKRIRDDEVAAVQQKIHLLDEQLQQNIEEMDALKHLNQQLIVKESQSNHELQEARKEIIEDLSGYLNCPPIDIGTKRMGEIDEVAFRNAFESSFSSDKAWITALELCSLWQERIENPEWQPFRIGEDDKGNPKELLNEDDEVLQGLKDHWGDEIYNVVTSALIELQEYNPRERYVFREMWNFDKNRKATLKEGIQFISTQW